MADEDAIKLEEWEIRLKHDRDFVDCMCITNHKELPIHPKGGVSKPKDFERYQYCGREMRKLMLERGHDRTCLCCCQCFNNQEVLKKKKNI